MLTRTHLPVLLSFFTIFASGSIAADPAAIVPLPAKVQWKTGHCTLGSGIACDDACKADAELLAAMLRPATGIDFQIQALDSRNENAAHQREIAGGHDTGL